MSRIDLWRHTYIWVQLQYHYASMQMNVYADRCLGMKKTHINLMLFNEVDNFIEVYRLLNS